ADLLGQRVAAEAVEVGLGARAAQLELGEARLVDHADALAHRAALLADGVVPGGAPVAVLLVAAVAAVEPLRALPAEAHAPHGAALVQAVVERACLQRAG